MKSGAKLTRKLGEASTPTKLRGRLTIPGCRREVRMHRNASVNGFAQLVVRRTQVGSAQKLCKQPWGVVVEFGTSWTDAFALWRPKIQRGQAECALYAGRLNDHSLSQLKYLTTLKDFLHTGAPAPPRVSHCLRYP